MRLRPFGRLWAVFFSSRKPRLKHYLISYLPQLGEIFCAPAHVVSH